MKKCILQVEIKKVTTLSGKGLQVSWVTREYTAEQAGYLVKLHECYANIVIFEQVLSDNDLKEAEKDIDPLTIPGAKTPSQRLRAVLFILWEQGLKKLTFEEFYKMKMETLISHFKDKLE